MDAARLVSQNDIVTFFQERQNSDLNLPANYYQRCIDAVQGHWSQYRTPEEARVAEMARRPGTMTREEREVAGRLAREVTPPELEAALASSSEDEEQQQQQSPQFRQRRGAGSAATTPEQQPSMPPSPQRTPPGEAAAGGAGRARRGPSRKGGAPGLTARSTGLSPERQERIQAALDQFNQDAQDMQAAFRGLPRDVQDVLLDVLPFESRSFFQNLQGVEAYARDIVTAAAKRRRARILGQDKLDKIRQSVRQGTLGSSLKLLAVAQKGVSDLVRIFEERLLDLTRDEDEVSTIMSEIIEEMNRQLPGWVNPNILRVDYLERNGQLQYPIAHPSEDSLGNPSAYDVALSALFDLIDPVEQQIFDSVTNLTVATARALDDTALQGQEQLEGALLEEINYDNVDTVSTSDLAPATAGNFTIVSPFGDEAEEEQQQSSSPAESMTPPTPRGAAAAGRSESPSQMDVDPVGANELGGGVAPEDGLERPGSDIARAHSIDNTGPLNNYNAVLTVAQRQVVEPANADTDWVHPYGAAGSPQGYDTKRIIGEPFWSISDVRSVINHLYGEQNSLQLSDAEKRDLFMQIHKQTTSRFDSKYAPSNLANGWSLMVNMARANDETSEQMAVFDQDAMSNQLDVLNALRVIFEGSLKYIGKQSPTGEANGIRIFEASDPAALNQWLTTRGGSNANRQQGRAFYKLCGSVDANNVVEGGLTIQPVVSEEVVLNLVSQPDRRASGFRVYFAVTDNNDQELLGFLQTVDLTRHPQAVRAGEASPMILQLQTNEGAFDGNAQLPEFEPDEVMLGADTQVMLPNNRPNRLAHSLFIDYVCTKTTELYQGREVQVIDTWFDEQGRSWALIIDPLRSEDAIIDPLRSENTPTSAASRIQPVAVPRSEVRHTSPYLYVGHLLFLHALLNEVTANKYGLMLTVSPKGIFDIFYDEDPISGRITGAQGEISQRPNALARAGAGDVFDSNLVSMYQRYWRLERGISWRNLTRDSGLVWLQDTKNKTSGRGKQRMQPYVTAKPMQAKPSYTYKLRSTYVDNGRIVHESFEEAEEREMVSDVLVPYGIMYRPYPTLYDLASFIAQLGASIIGALLPVERASGAPVPTSSFRRAPSTMTQTLMQQLPLAPAANAFQPFAPVAAQPPV